MNKHESSPASAEESQFSAVSEYWPQLFLGIFLASGIIVITSDVNTSVLFWLPPAMVLAWALIAVVFRPKKVDAEAINVRRLALEAEQRFLDGLNKKDGPAQAVQSASVTAKADTPAIAAKAEMVEESNIVDPATAPFADGQDVIVLWGSETGNAEGLAEMTALRLKDKGLAAKTMDMGKVTAGQLCNIPQILIITSTWGDGEPPSNAIDLWETLKNKKINLSKVKFSVLGLGDTSYPQFCQCGKDFDSFMEGHGAQRIHPRVDCDLDYEANFESWLSGVALKVAKGLVPA